MLKGMLFFAALMINSVNWVVTVSKIGICGIMNVMEFYVRVYIFFKFLLINSS